MSDEERRRWEERYIAGEGPPEEPSALVTALEPLLPRRGRALDLAGGAGRHAVWLAQRGLEVTVADISPTALALARRRAASASVRLDTTELDLDRDAPPPGPWDLILVFHYLNRGLYRGLPGLLAPGGVLAIVQPTRSNLQRHARPGPAHVLEDGELPRLVAGVEVLLSEEGWTEEGRHEARLVARRP